MRAAVLVGPIEAKLKSFGGWPRTQAECDEVNALMRKDAEEWRRKNLPRIRAAIRQRGRATEEEIVDRIIHLEDLTSDPHEVWQPNSCWEGGYSRVEIEG